MDLIVGFGSLVIIPFLGILALLKKRAFPYLVGFCVLWLLFGAVAFGGVASPMNPAPIVTREGHEAYLASSYVRFVRRLWLSGLVIGVPLSTVTWLYERTRASTVLKAIKIVATIAGFVGGLFSFIKFVIVPRFFS